MVILTVEITVFNRLQVIIYESLTSALEGTLALKNCAETGSVGVGLSDNHMKLDGVWLTCFRLVVPIHTLHYLSHSTDPILHCFILQNDH